MPIAPEDPVATSHCVSLVSPRSLAGDDDPSLALAAQAPGGGGCIDPDVTGGQCEELGRSAATERHELRRSKSWDESDNRRSFVSPSLSLSNPRPLDLSQQRKPYGDDPDSLDPLREARQGEELGRSAARERRRSRSLDEKDSFVSPSLSLLNPLPLNLSQQRKTYGDEADDLTTPRLDNLTTPRLDSRQDEELGRAVTRTRRRSRSSDENDTIVPPPLSLSNLRPLDLSQQRKTYGDDPDNVDPLVDVRTPRLTLEPLDRHGSELVRDRHGSDAALNRHDSEAALDRRGSGAALGRRGSEVALLSADDEKDWAAARRFTIVVGRRREWAAALALCGLGVAHACDAFDAVWWPLLTAEIAPEANHHRGGKSLSLDPAAILRGLGAPSRAFLQRLLGGVDSAPASSCAFGHFLCATWHFAMAADDTLPRYLFALYDADRDDACTLAEVAQMVRELCGGGGGGGEEAELLPDLCNRLFRVPLERVKDAAALTVPGAVFARVVSNQEARCGAALLAPMRDARAWLRCVRGRAEQRRWCVVGVPRRCLRPSRPSTSRRFPCVSIWCSGRRLVFARQLSSSPAAVARRVLFDDADDRSDAVMGDAFWAALAAEGRSHPTRDDVHRALSKAYGKVAESAKLRERDEAELVRARKVGRRVARVYREGRSPPSMRTAS